MCDENKFVFFHKVKIEILKIHEVGVGRRLPTPKGTSRRQELLNNTSTII